MKATTILAASLAAATFVAAGCTAGPGNANVAGNRMATSNNVNSTGSNPNREPDTSIAGNTANSNASSPTSTAAMSDDDFLKEAAMGGMEEVELGKVAGTKGTDPEVKKFGQMMVTDHSKANEELKALAAKKNVQLPTALDAKHQSDLDAMKAKSGKDFDTAYVTNMIEDHEKDVAAFESKSQNATDPDIKAWATKTLPTLKKHLETIRSVQAKAAMSQNK